MPQKKRVGDAGTNPQDEPGEPAAPKRQRVSLACDACRTARERCDGLRPRCGTCVSQNRSCSYTPTAKKRGVQTGYLRTIELSLAWLLYEQAPESEEALYRLLINEGGVLQKKGKAADRLHKKWSKSRVSKEISRILSGAPSQYQVCGPHLSAINSTSDKRQSKVDSSGEGSDTEGDGDGTSMTDSNDPAVFGNSPIVPRPRTQPDNPSTPTLKLPSNWRRLVDIYFTYTHCWFPLLDKQRILETGLGYPADGLPAPAGQTDVAACYAELWAVMALAAFQNPSAEGSSSEDLSAKRMYAVARSLIPSEESQFELPHLRSLLLHGLVLIGQGADLAAWMLIGTATRLALHLRGTGGLFVHDGRRDEVSSRSGFLTLAACFILDTLTSAALGQDTSLQMDLTDILNVVSSYGDFAESEAWQPLPGFNGAQGSPESQLIPTQPVRMFRQLLRFIQILSANLNQKAGSNFAGSGAEELGKSLDPNYAFCNSVILGGTTPAVPSAFLLQIAFMVTTIRLMRGFRASILSSVMEIAEACISSFGTCGTPPVVVGLLGIVQRCGHVEKMHQSEQSKWSAMMDSLKRVWKADDWRQGQHSYGTPYSATTGNPSSAVSSGGDFVYATGHVQHGYLPTRSHSSMGGQLETQHNSGLDFTLPQAQGLASNPPFTMGPPSKSPANSRSMSLASPNMQSSGRGTGASVFSGGGDVMDQTIDYDAILEELGSIDANDGLDMDPQFMTNLGFAPGCDLGEMFQGDFGV